jgi:S-adenosylmethionine:tRNA ribosyltransferase-isomerase
LQRHWLISISDSNPGALHFSKDYLKNNFKLYELESYDYELPTEKIAQHPVSPRDSSKLLFLRNNSFEDHIFRELPMLLQEGDLLVINNTRVLPARLQCDRGEVLLVQPTEKDSWDTIIHPGKRFKVGTILTFANGTQAEVVSESQIGRILKFGGSVDDLLDEHGAMPLPPYIDRAANEHDRKTYQTIYAKHSGSIAAPTAGLHFTRRVFQTLKERGVEIAKITLHVGPGTFRPVKDVDIRHHQIHPEYYRCTRATWKKIQNAKRVIAVGTTTTRTLETIAGTQQLEGSADLFIYPGYEFRCVQGLITNFHLPKSSLLMLVSAFAGYDLIRKAYAHAVSTGYRFYSYGDAMLIL